MELDREEDQEPHDRRPKDLATQANLIYKMAISIPRDRKKWRRVGNPSV